MRTLVVDPTVPAVPLGETHGLDGYDTFRRKAHGKYQYVYTLEAKPFAYKEVLFKD